LYFDAGRKPKGKSLAFSPEKVCASFIKWQHGYEYKVGLKGKVELVLIAVVSVRKQCEKE